MGGGLGLAARTRAPRRGCARAAAGLLCAGLGLLFAGPARAQASTYDVEFSASLMPSQGLALASIRVEQTAHQLRSLEFEIDEERIFNFAGSGEIAVADGVVKWSVPESGGKLEYSVRVDHLREAAEYDARLSRKWALLRGSDLFPPGKTRVVVGSRSISRLRLKYPPRWKGFVPYKLVEGGWYRIDDPATGYDRPSGWMIFGESLRNHSATISGMQLRMASPPEHGVRARDTIALLRWTLPVLAEVVRELPDRLLIVAAGDPMWRGGLSGPASLYLHADRPLIASDGTSPVLHELVHVVTRSEAGPGGDWIVEGLAEYYSLELLVRSGTISEDEYAAAMARKRRQAAPVSELGSSEAGTGQTARGVLIMRELDEKIRARSEGERSLDDVLRWLVHERRGRIDLDVLKAALAATVEGDYASVLPGSRRR